MNVPQSSRARERALLELDRVSPAFDFAGCWSYDRSTQYQYRLPGHHLLLVESGHLIAHPPTGRFEARAGDFICFRPTEHNAYEILAPTVFYQAHLRFAPPPRDRATPGLGALGPLPVQLSLGAVFEPMRRVFEIFCAEIRQPGAAHQLRLRGAVLEMLALAADVLSAQAPVAVHGDAWEQVRARIASEPAVEFNGGRFARQLGLSTHHFVRQFRQRFGVTPKAFHTHTRLCAAVRALRASDESVKSIAAGLGFTDARILYRSFKRHLGVTPSEMRAGKQSSGELTHAAPLFLMNRHNVPPGTTPDMIRKFYPQASPALIATFVEHLSREP